MLGLLCKVDRVGETPRHTIWSFCDKQVNELRYTEEVNRNLCREGIHIWRAFAILRRCIVPNSPI